MKKDERRLVLIRHVRSDWNQSNRFTGWIDIPLTEQGLNEAAAVGRRLADEGIEFDAVHTSVLCRTQQTADSLLAAAGHRIIPRHASWRLNERHYGQLQGMYKEEIVAAWGEQNTRCWWRGYFDAPPPLDMNDPRHPRFDSLYAGIDPALLPSSESLSDCQRRLLPYWYEVLMPSLVNNLSVLVISHGNTIRSLVMHLEQIAPDAIEKVEIPSGTPLIYWFNEKFEVVKREWLIEQSRQDSKW